MNSILLPTDFSNNANRALEYAVQLSKGTGARITLLHVYTPVVSKSNAMRALITDEVGDARREALEKLAVIINTITREFPEVKCESQVRVGEAVEEILLAALESKSDLIIMGTLGASNITKMIFGSNTASIIEKSECPVLAIPYGCTFRPPERILFATNFKYNDLEGVKKLTEIAQTFGAEIILGHVDVSITEEEEEELHTMENFFNEVQIITDYPKISCQTVSDHNVSMGLDKIIEEHHIDWFALSTQKRTWFEKISNPSLTKKISHYTTIPLLAFHNPADDEMAGPDF
jgi:nucleotide-binding universal stress UspA family protein